MGGGLGQVLVARGFGGQFEWHMQSLWADRVGKQQVRVGAIYQRGSKCMWVTVPWVLPVAIDIAGEVLGARRSSIVFKHILGDPRGHTRDLTGDGKPTPLIPSDPSPIPLRVHLLQSSHAKI